MHRIRERAPEGVEVGTVDRFQGRQAPIVFYAMTCSSGEEAPRGIDFLLDDHRSTSRSREPSSIWWSTGAHISEGGAAELLQQLAHVYLGPGVKFPPIDDPPAGFITHITVERIGGVGPWAQ